MLIRATPDSVVETCLRLAKDATRDAIDATVAAAGQLDSWRDGGLAELRRAFAPFDSVGDVYARPALNARTPSRLHAIEELPVAVGLLMATGGDYEETVLGGVNYGRDSDSIASMGGALAGALGNPLRRDWVDDVSAASKLDLEAPGRTMAVVAAEIFDRDAQRHAERARALGALTAGRVGLGHIDDGVTSRKGGTDGDEDGALGLGLDSLKRVDLGLDAGLGRLGGGLRGAGRGGLGALGGGPGRRLTALGGVAPARSGGLASGRLALGLGLLCHRF